MNWITGKFYKIEYKPACLRDYTYIGVVIGQDDTWIYAKCDGVVNKSFRKSQVTGYSES
jgi:hypothetical protein